MKYEEMGNLIRQHREKLGWDQAALAKTLQVEQQTVSRWEKGGSRPKRDVVVALAQILQTEVDPLLAVAGYELVKPVRPLLKELPLSSLNAEDFELFCRAFIAALQPGADVSRYGGQGDTQEGIDLYAKKGGRILDYQCKRHSQFGPADVTKVIKDTTFKAEHHHLLLSRNATAAARRAILGRDDWTLWDVEDISAKIQQELSPDEAHRIVRVFFPGWSKDFLGIDEVSPWLTPEEFFGPLANRVKLFSHDWSFVGRQPELEALSVFAKSDDRVLIVSGRGGVGKSRLLRAFSQGQPETSKVVFTSSSNDIKPRDFDLLPKHGVLVMDDVHESADLSQLLTTLALVRPGLKLILSTRPYGVSQIQSDLTRSGFVVDPEATIKLNDLSVEDAKQLSEEIITEVEGDVRHAQRIAEITNDCPLATVIGSRLVASGHIKPELLNNSEEFRRHLLMTFRNIITGEIGGKNAEEVRELLDLIATIQPIDPADPAFEVVASSILGRRYDKILRDIRELEDAGVLLRRRNKLRITPDLLGDYIRADAAYDERNARPTGFVDRVFEHVKDGLATNLLVNLSQLDWRLSTTGVQTELLNSVWTELEGQFRSAGIRTRQAMLKALEKVAYYQPTQVLSFISIAIDEPTDEVEKDDDDIWFTHPSYASVLASIPPLLKYIAHNLEYLPRALELLRLLALNDRRATNQYPDHPLRVLTELAAIEPGKPLVFNEAILEHALGWLDKPTTPNFSPFDIFDSLLATEGHQTEASGIKITLIPYKVRAEAVTELRAKIIDVAFEAAKTRPLPEAIRAVKTLGEALQSPWGNDVTKEDKAQWEPGQLAVLKRLKELVADTSLDPYVSVEVRSAVSWHATFSKSATRTAAKEVLTAIPVTIPYEVSRGIQDGWGWTFERSEDFKRNEAAFTAWRNSLVKQLIKDHQPDFVSLVELLEERISVFNTVNLSQHGDGGPFIGSLVGESAELGKVLCRYILDHIESPLASYFGSAVIALSQNDYDAALGFVEEGIQTGNEDLLLRISWAFGWGFRGNPMDAREIALMKIIMESELIGVRKNVIRAMERFSQEQRPDAIAMLLSMKFADSKDLTDEVLGQFGKHGPFKVSDLTASELEPLLSQLVEVNDIGDYNIGNFLADLSHDEPGLVLSLYMRRVEHQERDEKLNDYHPLPYVHHGDEKLHFHKTPEYEQLLRTVRDWSDEKPESWTRHHYGPELFKLVSAGYDEVTLRVLNEWIMSPERRHLEVAASLLSEVRRTFLWDNSDYVIQMLDRAQQHGESCYKRVSSHLHSVAYQGTRSGIPGQPFPEDIEQRDKSKELMDKLAIGSPGHRFYKSLYEIALSNIKRDTIDEEDLFED